SWSNFLGIFQIFPSTQTEQNLGHFTHGKEKVAKEQTRYPEWKAFVDAIQKETERTKNELTGRINNLQTQVDTLRERVNTLSNKYDAALGHIAEWRHAHPDEVPDRPAPAAIKHDL
ncbi:hypothetical protein L3H37_10635, partial [Corynebacterium sp. MC-20]|nr:hypothetical protein [Corynebacterium parakroppenstedtii]